MPLPPNAIPLPEVVVTRWYGDWCFSESTSDPICEVIDAHEAGATRITISVPEVQS